MTQRYATEQAAKKKIEKYGAAAAEANIDFVPLAVDTSAAGARRKVSALVATRWGRRLNLSPSQVVMKLNVCLAGVARVVSEVPQTQKWSQDPGFYHNLRLVRVDVSIEIFRIIKKPKTGGPAWKQSRAALRVV